MQKTREEEGIELHTRPPLPESKYLTLPNDIKVHYIEAGPENAPPLLLTHGFLSSHTAWLYNVEPLSRLSEPRRVIALDWVGFGLSTKLDTAYSLFYFADFLRDFADALGLKQFDLGGHSMGGKHNLAFAILYPQYVKKLLLVDTDGFVKDPWWTNHTEGLFKPIGQLTSNMLGKTWFLKKFAESVYYDRKFLPTQEELLEGAAAFREPDALAAIRAMNRSYPNLSLKLTGLRARLNEIKVPSLIVWGQQDKILDVSQAHIAQQEIPGAQLHIFDKCGHLPQTEHADEFNRLAVNFLDG